MFANFAVPSFTVGLRLIEHNVESAVCPQRDVAAMATRGECLNQPRIFHGVPPKLALAVMQRRGEPASCRLAPRRPDLLPNYRIQEDRHPGTEGPPHEHRVDCFGARHVCAGAKSRGRAPSPRAAASADAVQRSRAGGWRQDAKAAQRAACTVHNNVETRRSDAFGFAPPPNWPGPPTPARICPATRT
jgi:hypothetical protein